MPTDAEGNEVVMGPGRYRKRPLLVEAMEFDGTKHGARVIGHALDVGGPAGERRIVYMPDPNGGDKGRISIHTLEGWLDVGEGTIVIRGTVGELYPCAPDVFTQIYERVDG